MKNEIKYEWDFEEVEYDGEDADIVDHNFADHLSEFNKSYYLQPNLRLVLVRSVGNDIDGLLDRSWAYVQDDKLPEYFTDTDNCKIAKVPAKFHNELYTFIHQ